MTTGTGGGAALRWASGIVLILERSAWTWDGAAGAGGGDIQQGEVRILQAASARSTPQGTAPVRVYPRGAWRLTLAASNSKSSAEDLLAHLERNGFPATLVEDTRHGAPLYKVSLGPFRGRDEATKASQHLKGKFPGVLSPLVEADTGNTPPPAPQDASASLDENAARERTEACIEWGEFGSISEATRALRALDPPAPAPRLAQRRTDQGTDWWVYLPPQGSREGANRKVAELKRLGVQDYYIVHEDSRHPFAISLGVFSSEQAARKHLQQLQARGVRTARVAPRNAPQTTVFLQLRDLPQASLAKLAGLRGSFPGTALRQCAARK